MQMRKAMESQRRSLIHLTGEASQCVPPEQDIHEDNLTKENQTKVWLSLSAAIATLRPPYMTAYNWKNKIQHARKHGLSPEGHLVAFFSICPLSH